MTRPTRIARPTANAFDQGQRARALACLASGFLLVAGCAAGRSAYKEGVQAELTRNYEEALVHYQQALSEDPGNSEYTLKVEQSRFSAGFQHFEEGRRAMERGEYEVARAEFLRATQLDPSHDLARTELVRVDQLLIAGAPQVPETQSNFESRNDQARIDPSPSLRLSPTQIGPIDLVMTQDSQAVFEAIGALTGLSMLFDPNFLPQQLNVDVENLTVYEALDLVALLSNAFWVPVNQTTVMVAPNNTQARATYEQRILKTIYLENSTNPADMTEIMAALRQLLQLNNMSQSTSQNAITILDTPDKVAIAEKLINDYDKARAEVLVEATVLEVDRNRLRELGILPGQQTILGIDPDVFPAAPQVNLRDVDNLNSGSFSLTIPDTLARFLENDQRTKLVQNPSVRSSDGVLASIRIGSRVPVASGSFQPTVVGGGGTPVVQFQYIDVGVNMDITPRVLRNREVSMTVLVQVAGTAGDADLGGVILPIFSNREIRHEIRLKEGETNVLGGLISNAESNAISGLPGLSKIPFIGRLFSRESAQDDATEIIVLLTPHIIKMADVTQINLEGLRVGTQNDIRLRQPLPVEPPPAPVPQAGLELPPANAIRVAAELPASLQLTVDGVPLPSGMVSAAPGVETTLELRMAAENMIGADLTLEFDPGSIILRSITEGGLLSKDGTPVGLVQSIDRDRGIVEISLDRPADSPAISGEGALLQLKVEGLNPGASRVNVGGMSIRTGDPAPETQAAQVITNQ